MDLRGKPDWPRVRQRFEAWWQCRLLDRPLLQIRAPAGSAPPEEAPTGQQELMAWFTDPELVLPRLERQVAATYYGGDAFPVIYPVSTSLVAIEDAYLGAPYRIVPVANTGWATPCIEDWEQCPRLAVDPDNLWWRLSQRLLEEAAARGAGRYLVGIPDLQGGGQIVADMRGPERLATDLFEHPAAVRAALHEVNAAWLHYYQRCHAIIGSHREGYVDFLGVWSQTPYATVECDFSCMISPAMFLEFFLPAVRQQTEMVDRSIYHLDGPGAIRHLDALLALPRLTGIQWVPGAGQAPMSEWIPLLRRIQAAGKSLVLGCEPWEVEVLLRALKPEGLLIRTSCSSVAEADALLGEAAAMFGGAAQG